MSSGVARIFVGEGTNFFDEHCYNLLLWYRPIVCKKFRGATARFALPLATSLAPAHVCQNVFGAGLRCHYKLV